MSVFGLQVTAMLSMLSDHLGYYLCGNPLPMRVFGRFAFPIYAFLLAEGFRHYRDDPKRVEKHLKSLLVLTLVSEFCYDLLDADAFTVDEIALYQSNMITLLLAFTGLMAIERWKEQPLYMWTSIALTALTSFFAHANFKFAGPLLVYAFYYYLNNYLDGKYIKKLSVMLLIMVLYIPLYHWTRYEFCDWQTYVEMLKPSTLWWFAAHIPIAALLASYSGKRGYTSEKYRLVYKTFYPAHLFVLGVIKQFIM